MMRPKHERVLNKAEKFRNMHEVFYCEISLLIDAAHVVEKGPAMLEKHISKASEVLGEWFSDFT